MKKIEFTKPKQGKPHRVHQWVNTDTMEPLFGVECNVEYGRWVHVVSGDVVYLCGSKKDASAAAKAWSKPA